jgi:3-oxoadipate enol-lactonase
MQAEVNGIQLHYTIEGEGPPVVLLHGYQLDRTFWEPQVRALRGRYRIVAPDLRGHGSSEVGNLEASSMEQQADDVRALLDRIALREPVVLGGLSMGGYVTLAFLKNYPERVRALILADTRAGPDTEDARRGRLAIVEQVEQTGSTQPAIDALFPKLMAPANYDRLELVTHVRAMASRASERGITAALRGMAARPDSTPWLGQVRLPTLVIVGQHDVLTPPSEARAMQAAIPNAELVEIPAAGHLSTLEDPETVNAALLRFLEQNGIR